jgi:hypothetical protein
MGVSSGKQIGEGETISNYVLSGYDGDFRVEHQARIECRSVETKSRVVADLRADKATMTAVESKPVSPIDPNFGEEKAQSCDIAWLRQLAALPGVKSPAVGV